MAVIVSLIVITRVTRSVKRGIVIVHVRMSVCLFVCLFVRLSVFKTCTAANTQSRTRLMRHWYRDRLKCSPHWQLLAALRTVAVLSQSSGVTAIFCHEAGSRGLQ